MQFELPSLLYKVTFFVWELAKEWVKNHYVGHFESLGNCFTINFCIDQDIKLELFSSFIFDSVILCQYFLNKLKPWDYIIQILLQIGLIFFLLSTHFFFLTYALISEITYFFITG